MGRDPATGSRPAGLSVVGALAFLLLLAAPVVGIHTEKLSLDKLLPANTSIMQSYDRITRRSRVVPPGPVVVATADVRVAA